MAIDLKLKLTQSQQLIMTPQLQQAIKLLQLSRLELQDVISKEMLENPVIEENAEVLGDSKSKEEKTEQEKQVIADEAAKAKENDFDWNNYIESYNSGSSTPAIKPPDDMPSIEASLSKQPTLFDHLMWQLSMMGVSRDFKIIAESFIGNINSDGYLTTTVEDIAEKLQTPIEEVEKVYKMLQTFDPPGVFSRDLKECLLVQIKLLKLDGQANLMTVINDHLHDLEKKNYNAISKALKIPLEAVYDIVKIIMGLEPKPGRAYSGEEIHYITPDVYVKKIAGEYVILLNEDGLPKLKISNFYKNALQEKGTSSMTKEYIQEKLKSAVWLIKSIHQRQRTIYKTAESIVKFQKDFFEHGTSHLRPMVLKTVADDIGMHESTISRVTTNKYVHTDHGLFELKYFFNSGIGRTQGDHDIASESVKSKIKHLIENEDPKRPVSDQKLVELLKRDNIDIARRTVAKYRELLGILSSSKRRKLF
jgi:RNA polymerase sigma-54 factor